MPYGTIDAGAGAPASPDGAAIDDLADAAPGTGGVGGDSGGSGGAAPPTATLRGRRAMMLVEVDKSGVPGPSGLFISTHLRALGMDIVFAAPHDRTWFQRYQVFAPPAGRADDIDLVILSPVTWENDQLLDDVFRDLHLTRRPVIALHERSFVWMGMTMGCLDRTHERCFSGQQVAREFEIVAPGDPLAAGYSGVLPFRAFARWGTPSLAAERIVRIAGTNRFVLFAFRTGAPLLHLFNEEPEAPPAPAPRVGFGLLSEPSLAPEPTWRLFDVAIAWALEN